MSEDNFGGVRQHTGFFCKFPQCRHKPAFSSLRATSWQYERFSTSASREKDALLRFHYGGSPSPVFKA
jgi:hypothetical protein